MRSRGFTLVEMILVIVLMGLVTAMSLPLLMGGFNSYFQQRQTADIERRAMLALERITREVRPASNIATSSNTVTFTRGGTNTTIGYNGGAQQLYINRGSGNGILAEGVTSANFNEATHDSARYIDVQFNVADSTHTWRVSIYPRNDQP